MEAKMGFLITIAGTWRQPLGKKIKLNPNFRASLMAQRLRICLPVQEALVQSLVQEDPTGHRATNPMHHNYRACALEPWSHNC